MDDEEFYQWLKIAEVYINTPIFSLDIALQLLIEEFKIDDPKRRKPRRKKVFIMDEIRTCLPPS